MKYYTDISGGIADDSGDLIELSELSFTQLVNDFDACAAESEFEVRYMGFNADPDDHFLYLTRK